MNVPQVGIPFGPDGKHCGAQSKRTGKPCRQPAMKNGRCRLHGGKSTGPRTRKGKALHRIAVTKHGAYAGPNNPLTGPEPGYRWPGLGAERARLRRLIKEMRRR